MTAAPELYVRDGSRFVRVDELEPDQLAAPSRPTVPLPDVVAAEVEPLVMNRPGGGWAIHAPRCPHNHFARWAARNCRPCIREESRRAR